MSKEIWATKFSEDSIFCTCDCHSKARLKHPQHCFFCAELHKPENFDSPNTNAPEADNS